MAGDGAGGRVLVCRDCASTACCGHEGRRDDVLRRATAREREATPLPPLIVGAETVEEALVFVAAALTEADSREAESLAARVVIVDDLDAFRTCLHVQSAEPLLILPTFEGVPRAQAAGHRVHLVLPVLAGSVREDGDDDEPPEAAAWIATMEAPAKTLDVVLVGTAPDRLARAVELHEAAAPITSTRPASRSRSSTASPAPST